MENKDISYFEATEFYKKYAEPWHKEEKKRRREEAIVDFFLAMAIGFFLGTYILTVLITHMN